jgi:hypothetical protein
MDSHLSHDLLACLALIASHKVGIFRQQALIGIGSMLDKFVVDLDRLEAFAVVLLHHFTKDDKIRCLGLACLFPSWKEYIDQNSKYMPPPSNDRINSNELTTSPACPHGVPAPLFPS